MDKHKTNKEGEWSGWHGESGGEEQWGFIYFSFLLNFSVNDCLKARAKTEIKNCDEKKEKGDADKAG